MADKNGDLRVWWISNPPNKGIKVPVKNIDEALLVLKTLADYDLYLEDLIDCNAQGLEVFEDGEWSEYYDEDGRDINEIEKEREEQVNGDKQE